MAIRVMTDGGADYPAEWKKEGVVHCIPLYVTFGGKRYEDVQGEPDFYDMMKTHSELPKTASPSPEDFLRAFALYPDDDILLILLSSSLSSTYAHARLAKEMAEETGVRSGRIEVIDSLTASLGTGLLLFRALEDIRAGHSFDDIVRRSGSRVKHTRTVFYLDTLENVIKGGRLDRTKGTIASVLSIKLVMQASEAGEVEVTDKVRGRKNALIRLIDKLEDARHGLEEKVLGIAHSNCLEEAVALKDRILQRYPFRHTIITDMGPVIGTYAGERGLLVCYN
ncbi:EDD domain protein, DegV family [Paenibacillus sp. UNCCL117]|uniref:DegV family protein n=1 Tax=unclassified Paenibacillus TaxID=185978 RepID=UPI0008847EB1|nr:MULTISPECIES: DegV family protein [unclassified Paenibacillus]SDC53903.1 EDD domain protein, DegV family [Paenibacillus sp. cl123]SFW11125.1 EDD domain protein, DegV family [Paenibacillus sp. UNCCL117]